MVGNTEEEISTAARSEYYSLQEIADELGMPVDRVRKYRAAGYFPSVKNHRTWRVPAADAEKFMSRIRCGESANPWEPLQREYFCEALPDNEGDYLSLKMFCTTRGLNETGVLEMVHNGQLEAFWRNMRWWIPKFQLDDHLQEQGDTRKWYRTLSEIANDTWLSEETICDHRNAKSFPAIETSDGCFVPNSCAREFIERVRNGTLPGIWESAQRACQCEKRPDDTVSLEEAAKLLNISTYTVLHRIIAGRIEAWYVEREWWVSEFVDGQQRNVKRLRPLSLDPGPCFVADVTLRGFFKEGVEFCDFGAYTAKAFRKRHWESEYQIKEYYFAKGTRLQDGRSPEMLRGSCGNVLFTLVARD